MDRNAIKDLAVELHQRSRFQSAVAGRQLNSIVDRFAAKIGVTLTPRPNITTLPPDDTEVAGIAAPIIAAMGLVYGTDPGFVPGWDAAFDKITATLINCGWAQRDLGARDRFVAPAVIRQIALDRSHLLRPGTPVWPAAFTEQMPYHLEDGNLGPVDEPGARFVMLQHEKTGAAAFVALKMGNPMTTLSFMFDFAACDRVLLRKMLQDAAFSQALTSSTTKVDGDVISIDAKTHRPSRDGLATVLKADIGPPAITEELRALGLPASVGALEAQLEEAMY